MPLYYHIVVAFDINFFGIYFSNLIAVVLNTLGLLPLYLYVYQINFLNKSFWRWFLVLRLAFDVTGHNYEMNFIKALSHDNALLSMKAILTYVMLNLPSYMALYVYAFSNDPHSQQKTKEK